MNNINCMDSCNFKKIYDTDNLSDIKLHDNLIPKRLCICIK